MDKYLIRKDFTAKDCFRMELTLTETSGILLRVIKRLRLSKSGNY